MRRTRMLAMAAASLLVCGSALAQDPPAAGASREWKRVRSEHFVAAGNAAYPDIRSVLLELEGFRRALARSLPGARLAGDEPTTVVVFRDEASFRPFKPVDERGARRDGIAGYFLSGPGAQYIVVAVQRDPRRTFQHLFHEYTHAVIRRNLGDVPEWLNEGLAELYSTLQAQPRERRAILGQPPASRMATLRTGAWLPLGEVLAFDKRALLTASPARTAAFYAQSWALVHYLQFADGGAGGPRLDRYLAVVKAGASVEDAVQAAFGMGLAQFEDRVRRYIRQSTLPTRVLQEPAGFEPPRTYLEAMREPDVAALQQAMLAMIAAAAAPHDSRR